MYLQVKRRGENQTQRQNQNEQKKEEPRSLLDYLKSVNINKGIIQVYRTC